MELQVGVKALLKNKEGKYLLLLRSAEKYPETGAQWDIVGGRIDPGSTLIENLKREIKEETSLDLTEQPKLVAAQDILRGPKKHMVRLTYMAPINDGNVVLDEDHTEFRWFNMEELQHLENLNINMYFKELLEDGKLGV